VQHGGWCLHRPRLQQDEGAILRFEGPLGTFFLREDSDKPIIFLASGTGFAPIKSIVEHAFHNGVTRQMVLYWGGRVRSELYMVDLALKWQQEHDNFSFVPVLSDAPPGDNWDGRVGFVHRAVGTFPTCPATRSTPAARRSWSRRRTPTRGSASCEDEFYRMRSPSDGAKLGCDAQPSTADVPG
jgi:hypothetical protein